MKEKILESHTSDKAKISFENHPQIIGVGGTGLTIVKDLLKERATKWPKENIFRFSFADCSTPSIQEVKGDLHIPKQNDDGRYGNHDVSFIDVGEKRAYGAYRINLLGWLHFQVEEEKEIARLLPFSRNGPVFYVHHMGGGTGSLGAISLAEKRKEMVPDQSALTMLISIIPGDSAMEGIQEETNASFALWRALRSPAVDYILFIDNGVIERRYNNPERYETVIPSASNQGYFQALNLEIESVIECVLAPVTYGVYGKGAHAFINEFMDVRALRRRLENAGTASKVHKKWAIPCIYFGKLDEERTLEYYFKRAMKHGSLCNFDWKDIETIDYVIPYLQLWTHSKESIGEKIPNSYRQKEIVEHIKKTLNFTAEITENNRVGNLIICNPKVDSSRNEDYVMAGLLLFGLEATPIKNLLQVRSISEYYLGNSWNMIMGALDEDAKKSIRTTILSKGGDPHA